MTTAWAHLPNAELINQVLGNLIKYRKEFRESTDASYGAARFESWSAAYSAVQMADRDASYDAACGVARVAARREDCDAAWNLACDVILCLIAYDDCGFWLSPEFSLATMKVSHRLNGHPSTLLLQPYKLFLESSWVTGQT